MLDPIKNLVYVNAITGYSSSDLIITLQSGEGAKLPQPSTDGAFNLVWYNHTDYKNPADDANAEIIRVTGRSGDTLTISRAQESTVASNKNISGKSYRLILGLTKKMIDDLVTNLSNRFNGACVVPSFTDNGDGSVTIGSGDYCLSSNANGSGLINTYTIAGNTFTLTNLAMNYIVANYNSGTPVLQNISDVTLINETTIVPVYSVFRNGTVLHRQDWDALGLALANKIHQSIVKTQRYRRQSGLILSESGTRNLNLTTGIVWTGAVPITLDAIATATDNLRLWYHSGGVWNESVITQYNNTQYDNGTNLVTLSGAGTQYAVNWVFRGVESSKHLYVVLGTGNYNLAQAEAATVPALPEAISSHAVLVGKVIVAENQNTATSIQSAFDTQFSFSTPASHADLTNLDYANSGHTGFAAKDANNNIAANNFLSDYATTATAGTSTTLTVASKFQQFFTGTLAQTVVMPVATTLVNGQQWQIVNNSTGAVTVNTSGGNTIITLPGGTSALVTCINTAGGTGVASWNASYSPSLSSADTLTNKTLTKPVINGTNPTGATYAPASGAQTVAIDCASNNMHIVTGNASGTAITFTIANATNNQPFIISILQGGTTVSTIAAWFATIRWAGGTAPTLTATLNKRDTFGFIRTGANTYDGFIIGQNC